MVLLIDLVASSSLGFGSLYLVVIASYGLAVWIGGKIIIEKGYRGWAVTAIVFILLNGSMSLGQASPSLSAFIAGQVIISRIFETIKREAQSYDSNTTGLGGSLRTFVLI